MSCHVCYVYRKSLGQHLTLSGEATQYQTGMASLNPYLVICIFLSFNPRNCRRQEDHKSCNYCSIKQIVRFQRN